MKSQINLISQNWQFSSHNRWLNIQISIYELQKEVVHVLKFQKEYFKRTAERDHVLIELNPQWKYQYANTNKTNIGIGIMVFGPTGILAYWLTGISVLGILVLVLVYYYSGG